MAARKTWTVASKPGLNVRKYPEKDAPVLRVLPDGEKITVDSGVRTEAGWKALVGGGYVMSEYLK